MKKGNLATQSQQQAQVAKCELAVSGHEHLHAANCGHKSYVHAGHICYEHDGHYHYMHDGHAHECAGPFAQPVARSTSSTTTMSSGVSGKKSNVVKMDTTRSKTKKK